MPIPSLLDQVLEYTLLLWAALYFVNLIWLIITFIKKQECTKLEKFNFALSGLFFIIIAISIIPDWFNMNIF